MFDRSEFDLAVDMTFGSRDLPPDIRKKAEELLAIARHHTPDYVFGQERQSLSRDLIAKADLQKKLEKKEQSSPNQNAERMQPEEQQAAIAKADAAMEQLLNDLSLKPKGNNSLSKKAQKKSREASRPKDAGIKEKNKTSQASPSDSSAKQS